LFGHVRGAFTGAVTDARGYLGEANKGTLFLDEIGELPTAVQVKLLRALETKEFRPVGARADTRSDFRPVGATNQRASSLLQERHFRPDLLERIGGFVISVPSLDERREDIPALVYHFLRTTRDPVGRVSDISASALELLQNRSWPRNVRELRNVIARAATLCSGDVIHRGDVAASLGHLDAKADRPFRSFEQRRLEDVLKECEWDTALAADRLGVHRTTVYRRLKRLGIELREESPDTCVSPFESEPRNPEFPSTVSPGDAPA
jgi:two-component system response regulator HydG